MFCKKKATLLVAILCVFAVSFVACSKKDAVSSGAATGADGATSQEVTKADKKAEEKKAKSEEKKAEESKKGSSEAKLPTTPNAEEDFIVKLTEDGTGAVVKEYKGKSGGVYIPATIQGLPVKEVRFYNGAVTAVVVSDGCTSVDISGKNIKYVSLPDSVTEFRGLDETSITEFEVPARVQVFDAALPRTLEKVSFRGVPRKISARFGGTKITEIVIPEGVKEFAGFQGSKTLKTITLPDSIEVLDGWAFTECTALEVVNLPANLKYIYSSNFEF